MKDLKQYEQVLALMLGIGVTTSEQIQEFFDFDKVVRATNLLTRLKKEGYAESSRRDRSIGERYLYYITKKGIDYACQILGKEQYKLVNDEFVSVYSVPKKIANIFVPHALAVKLWYIRAVKYLNYENFIWYAEEGKKLVSGDGQYILDTDAMIKYNEKNLLMEQDLCTEHILQIYTKFNKYYFLFTEGKVNGPILLTILFNNSSTASITDEKLELDIDTRKLQKVRKELRSEQFVKKYLESIKGIGIESAKKKYEDVKFALDIFKEELPGSFVAKKEKELNILEEYINTGDVIINSKVDNSMKMFTLKEKEARKFAIENEKNLKEAERVSNLHKWLLDNTNQNLLYNAFLNGLDLYINNDNDSVSYLRYNFASDVNLEDKVFSYLKILVLEKYNIPSSDVKVFNNEYFIYEHKKFFMKRAIQVNVDDELELFLMVDDMSYGNAGAFARAINFIKELPVKVSEAAALILIVSCFEEAVTLKNSIGETDVNVLFIEESKLRGENYKINLKQAMRPFFVVSENGKYPNHTDIKIMG